MGNESSTINDCIFGEPVQNSTECGWCLQPAGKKDGSRVSVFVYERCDDNKLFLDNTLKFLRILRHPSIVRFHEKHTTSEDVYIVTDFIKPVERIIDKLDSAELCAGLYNILEALVFMHDKAKVCHNNLSLSSIYVSQDGSWKLGGLDFTCSFQDDKKDFLKQAQKLRHENAISPEEKRGNISTDPKLSHARDAYAFGILCEQLLDMLRDLGDITKTFELRIQDELLNPDPQQRPKLSSLLEDRLFSNEFLEVVNFLKNITMKNDSQKKDFFRSALHKLQTLSEELIATRLVEPLLSRFVLLDETAVKEVIPHLLTPKSDSVYCNIQPLLREDLYKSHVINVLYKIFHVHDVSIRLVLLQHFRSYVHLFDEETLKTFILRQLRLGCYDTNDHLVEYSLRALADLVPVIGGDAVIGCERVKKFSEGTPKASSDVEKKIPLVLCPVSPNIPKKLGPNDEKEEEKERRRKEIKKRNEERRKQKEEAQRNSKLALAAAVELSENPVQGTSFHEETDEYSAESNEKNPDWVDWDKDEDEALDYKIEQEIEKEIASMKLPKNNFTIEPIEEIHVDWSDVAKEGKNTSKNESRVSSKTGTLKLSKPKSKQEDSVTIQENGTFDDFGANGNSWETMESFTNTYDNTDKKIARTINSKHKANTITSPRTIKANPLKVRNNIKKSNPNRTLGSEFDILSIEVKKKNPIEEDFFLNMMPEIEINKSEGGKKSTSLPSSTSHSKQTVSFAVIDAAAEEVGGQWENDEELDWDTVDNW